MMKKFEDIERDTFDAHDASNATTTTRRHEYKAANQNEQIMHQLEAEFKKTRLKSAGVLKVTTKNMVKKLRIRQKMRITRKGKNVEARIKEIAIQEFQIKKPQMEE